MSTTNPNFRKDPDAILPYYIDWSDWLEDDDTIAASTWTLIGGLVEDSKSFDSTKTTIVLSGGVVGAATAKNHITTVLGYEEDRTLNFIIVER